MEDKYKLLFHNLAEYLFSPTQISNGVDTNIILHELEKFLMGFPKEPVHNLGYILYLFDTLNLYFSGSEELGFNFEITKSIDSKTHFVVSSKYISKDDMYKLNELIGSILTCNSYEEFCIISDIGDFHSIFNKGEN